LQGIGFGVHPETGADLLMVVSMAGFGLIDTQTGTKMTRDRDPEVATPTGPDLACPGIGVLAGARVPIAGLFGGGLHATTDDGWTVDVVAPEWPHQRVILSADGGRNDGPPGSTWWHVFDDERHGEPRAAGFPPSGCTLVVATACDVTLFRRPGGSFKTKSTLTDVTASKIRGGSGPAVRSRHSGRDPIDHLL
jgi:hypothetical protein